MGSSVSEITLYKKSIIFFYFTGLKGNKGKKGEAGGQGYPGVEGMEGPQGSQGLIGPGGEVFIFLDVHK